MFSHLDEWTKSIDSKYFVRFDNQDDPLKDHNGKIELNKMNIIDIEGKGKYHSLQASVDVKDYISNLFINEPKFVWNESKTFEIGINYNDGNGKEMECVVFWIGKPLLENGDPVATKFAITLDKRYCKAEDKVAKFGKCDADSRLRSTHIFMLQNLTDECHLR